MQGTRSTRSRSTGTSGSAAARPRSLLPRPPLFACTRSSSAHLCTSSRFLISNEDRVQLLTFSRLPLSARGRRKLFRFRSATPLSYTGATKQPSIAAPASP